MARLSREWSVSSSTLAPLGSTSGILPSASCHEGDSQPPSPSSSLALRASPSCRRPSRFASPAPAACSGLCRRRASPLPSSPRASNASRHHRSACTLTPRSQPDSAATASAAAWRWCALPPWCPPATKSRRCCGLGALWWWCCAWCACLWWWCWCRVALPCATAGARPRSCPASPSAGRPAGSSCDAGPSPSRSCRPESKASSRCRRTAHWYAARNPWKWSQPLRHGAIGSASASAARTLRFLASGSHSTSCKHAARTC